MANTRGYSLLTAEEGTTPQQNHARDTSNTVVYTTPRFAEGVRVLGVGTERSNDRALQQHDATVVGVDQLLKTPTKTLDNSRDKMMTGSSSSSSCPFGLPDVNSECFNMGVGVVIVFNAVVIGFETDLPANTFFTAMEHIFNSCFLLEMVLRLNTMGLGYFSEAWHLFDCTLVVTGTLDLWVLPAVTGGHNRGGIASLMRLLRILRILRVVRIFRMFRELTLIAQAFINAFSSVCWIGTLVVIVDYICAVFLTRILGHKATQWGDEHMADIDKWFGSIGRSMYTLFMVMTLAEWNNICYVAMEEYPAVVIFFMLYILVASYTMVSLITGVISESLISAQREDEINKIKAIEEGRRELKHQLQRIFESMDADQSGSISKEEIQEVIVHNQKVSAKLESLEISVSLEELMEIFDTILITQKSAAYTQGSRPQSLEASPESRPSSPERPSQRRTVSRLSSDADTIPIDQFVTALTAIRGQASSKETFLMRQEIKAIAHRQDEMFCLLQKLIEDQDLLMTRAFSER